MNVEATARQTAITLFGLANCGAGAFFLWLYLSPPGHVIQPTVIYALVVWIGFGAAIAVPKVIFGTAKQMIEVFRSAKSAADGTPKP